MNNFTNIYPGGATSDAVAHSLSDGIPFSVWLVLMVIVVIALWKVFQKAGQAGWKSLIPVYNAVILCRIANLSGWCVLLMLLPVVNLIFSIFIYVRMAKAFGKSGWFALGLFFLSPVFFLVLAFDGSAYRGPYYGKGLADPAQSPSPIDTTANATADATTASAPAADANIVSAATNPVAPAVPERAPEELHS